jgi:hypothetical protein
MDVRAQAALVGEWKREETASWYTSNRHLVHINVKNLYWACRFAFSIGTADRTGRRAASEKAQTKNKRQRERAIAGIGVRVLLENRNDNDQPAGHPCSAETNEPCLSSTLPAQRGS